MALTFLRGLDGLGLNCGDRMGVDERAEMPGSWKRAWADPAGPAQREREDER